MTKPISRKMAVDAILHRLAAWHSFHLPCAICDAHLEPGQDIQFDHHHADVFDGPHEYQNLRPVHAECHKKKTAQDIKDNSKIKRIRGERKPKPKKAWPTRKLQGRGFEKRVK